MKKKYMTPENLGRHSRNVSVGGSDYYQIVLFYTLITMDFDHFLRNNQPN